MLLLLSILCLVVCFPLSYKQDDIKTSEPLSTTIFVRHLANYALAHHKKDSRTTKMQFKKLL